MLCPLFWSRAVDVTGPLGLWRLFGVTAVRNSTAPGRHTGKEFKTVCEYAMRSNGRIIRVVGWLTGKHSRPLSVHLQTQVSFTSKEVRDNVAVLFFCCCFLDERNSVEHGINDSQSVPDVKGAPSSRYAVAATAHVRSFVSWLYGRLPHTLTHTCHSNVFMYILQH